mmetsp:Transcript_104032/g.333449  ORF Transcript_104032/g.333449 Transcript_104032/m.333449 type:complete len:824 (+) Transcript_104032:59-2530(+)
MASDRFTDLLGQLRYEYEKLSEKHRTLEIAFIRGGLVSICEPLGPRPGVVAREAHGDNSYEAAGGRVPKSPRAVISMKRGSDVLDQEDSSMSQVFTVERLLEPQDRDTCPPPPPPVSSSPRSRLDIVLQQTGIVMHTSESMEDSLEASTTSTPRATQTPTGATDSGSGFDAVVLRPTLFGERQTQAPQSDHSGADQAFSSIEKITGSPDDPAAVNGSAGPVVEWCPSIKSNDVVQPCKSMSSTFDLKRSGTNEKSRLSVQAALKTAGMTTAAQDCFVINPEQSVVLQKWDMITMTSMVFVAFVAPVQVAMLETKANVLFIVSSCIDTIFLIDIFINFCIMYQKRTNFGFVWEHRQSAIAARYVKGWFAIDFISILPFDVVFLLSSSAYVQRMQAIKVIRLLRLVKLARLLRVVRLFRRFEVRTSISYGQLSLVKFFCILFIITHWLACLWALTLVLVDPDDGVPRWIDDFDEQEKNVELKTRDTPWKLYIMCIYFTSYTITSVGYGDIGPVNIVERIVSIVMIVISGISWAVVLGQVCGIIVNLDSDQQTFRTNMDELNSMMSDRVLPTDMRQRLRSFFLSNKTAQRRMRHDRLISCMSPGLQGEVVMSINDRWIGHVSLLRQIQVVAKGASRNAPSFASFIVGISLRMTSIVHAQQELFGVPHVLYIVNRGLVSRQQRILQTGAVWGQDFVISDSRLVDPSQGYSLTYVELTTLSRESFMLLAEKYGSVNSELKRRVRRYCCWLAFQRAVWKEARRRQRRLKRTAQAQPSAWLALAEAYSSKDGAFDSNSKGGPAAKSGGGPHNAASASASAEPVDFRCVPL